MPDNPIKGLSGTLTGRVHASEVAFYGDSVGNIFDNPVQPPTTKPARHRKVRCPDCGRSCKGPNALKKHTKDKHGVT